MQLRMCDPLKNANPLKTSPQLYVGPALIEVYTGNGFRVTTGILSLEILGENVLLDLKLSPLFSFPCSLAMATYFA